MKKKWLLALIFTCFLFVPRLVFAVDFDILSYKGDLNIHADNTAVFKETITYHFKDDFNGQLIGLGKAGKMPKGFEIDDDPTVLVSKNGQIVQDVLSYTKEEEDGYKVIILNPGNAGDTVRVTVTWQLSNILFLYNDIAELNWQPLTDSSGDIKDLEFRVTSDSPAEKLFFHTGKLLNEGSVEKINDIYWVKMKDLPKKRQVELHAYWPREAFSSAPSQGLNEENLSNFKRVEVEIKANKVQANVMIKWIFPTFFMALLLLTIMYYRAFRKQISLQKVYPKNHRLYEPPMDLPPMVLAEAIYSTSLEEVSPLNKHKFGKFTFEQLIQATLLDLVDRGHLSIFQGEEEPWIKINSEKGLSNFEKECLRMTLSTKKEIALSDLFLEYQVSSTLFHGAKEADEKHIREFGLHLKRSFERRLQRMQSCVRDKVKILRLPSYYRPLTDTENNLVKKMKVCSAVTGLIGLIIFYYSLRTCGYFSIPLLSLGLLGLLASALVHFATRGPSRDGVLNEEGAEAFYLWTSFENMLRDIAHLEKAELESIVVWNRLLVYATLYGCAKKVNKIMKLHNIQLGNADMNLYVYCGWDTNFHASASHINHYATIANTASTFSVSSGSGSSGGGFSGGGGGGSVGAF
ncbi:DUF2207 domain-containing protein [Streptococcus infantis]|uniref:DUF2207 domain-containing protein n=1 Tax=Streptococcus TaxID=1301 RepID=UPI00034EBC30|nr:DUF2207 domain-containing protein [Streptococcus sp. HPH0090]EPD87869.1 hypothetical protein HMPREF1481_00960 [Streptococcus sp. HPH0090]